jgi:hypothetical protein
MKTRASKQILLIAFLFLNLAFVFGQQTDTLDTTIFPVAAVEEKPLFEGKGDTAIFRFMGRNIRLPMSVRDIVGTTGTAYIYYVIDETGHLDASSIKLLFFQPGPTKKDPKPKRIINEKMLNATQIDCVVESKRVIGLLKNWTAAKVGGKGVKCSMTMPVTFKNEGIINR